MVDFSAIFTGYSVYYILALVDTEIIFLRRVHHTFRLKFTKIVKFYNVHN